MRFRDLIVWLVFAVLVAAMATLLVSIPSPAHAIGELDGIELLQDGLPVANCDQLELPSSVWDPPSVLGSRCTITPHAGAGGAPAVVPFASCTPLDGTIQVYLAAGGCADPTESRAQVRLKSATVLGQLSCALSASAGGTPVVTALLRVGACGSMADTSVSCVIAAGQATCDGGAATASVLAGQCIALRVTSSATFVSWQTLGCTMRVLG